MTSTYTGLYQYGYNMQTTKVSAAKTGTATKLFNLNGLLSMVAYNTSGFDVYMDCTGTYVLSSFAATKLSDIGTFLYENDRLLCLEFLTVDGNYYLIVGEQKAATYANVSEIYRYTSAFTWTLDTTFLTPDGVLDLEVFDFYGEKYLAVVEPLKVSVYKFNRGRVKNNYGSNKYSGSKVLFVYDFIDCSNWSESSNYVRWIHLFVCL